jgi:RHS repeat-associated protein
MIDYPFLSYPQRGNLNVTYTLLHNGKAHDRQLCDSEGNCLHHWIGGGGAMGFGFSEGAAVSVQAIYWYTPPGGLPVHYYIYTLHTPDGSSHLLGQINSGTWPVVYQALDGSGWRALRYTNVQTVDVIISPEGVRQSQSQGSPQRQWEDTNGNVMNTSPDGTTLTDTMGRQIPGMPNIYATSNTDSSGCTGPLPITTAYLWTPPGQSGGTLQYKMCYVTVPVNLPSGPQVPSGLNQFTALQSLVLPNGTAWTFEYSDRNPGDAANINYGSLSKITLPTGGTISYTYTLGWNTGCGDSGSRWVNTRTVDANDGSGPHTWTYNYSPATTVTDPLGNYAVHTFINFGECSLYEKQTQYFDASGALLKTIATDFNYTATDLSQDPVGVRPIRVTTTWPNGKVSKTEKNYDAGFSYYNKLGTVANAQSVTYGKAISESDYDYGIGAPGALLRTINTQYSALTNLNYLNNNLMNQVWTTQVLDGNGNQVAYSYNDYDGTTPQPSGVNTQRDPNPPPAAPYRGNLTATHHWLNTTNGFISDNMSYYDTGKVYQTIDPLGHTTTFSYDPAFAGAYPTTVTDALNHSSYASYDFNTGVKLSATDANSQTTSYTYDNMLRVSTITGPPDPNNGGQQSQTNFFYNDNLAAFPMIYVRKDTKLNAGNTEVSWTGFDGVGRKVRSAKLNGEAAPKNLDMRDTCYDADGRVAVQNYPFQGPGWGQAINCSASTGDSFAYDGLGRMKQMTHSDGSSTTTNYNGAAIQVTDEGNGNTQLQRISQTDTLGRLTSVCEVSNTTLQSVTGNDGVPTACNQDIPATGFLTSYSYDTLGNLLGVTQGGLNQRSFSYDSLSRLLSSFNPEAGTTSYSYNDDGTVHTRTRPAPNTPVNSAATVTTTYQYDPLKRVTNATYSDGTTPNVTIAYDESSAYGLPTGLTNTIGRKSSEKVTDPQTGAILSASVYGYDVMGGPTYNGQCTVQSCASGPSGFYPVNYGYDLAGDTISSTNGMGVTFNSTYNVAAQLTRMTSTLNDANHPGTLLSGVHYNGFGTATTLNLGNGAVESLSYYPRGSLQSVNTIGPNPAANTPGTGSVNFSGAIQSTQIPNTPGSGSVTINGRSGRTLVNPDCTRGNCVWVYDSGSVTISVNGTGYTVSYQWGDNAWTLAAALTNLLNAGGLVTASYTTSGTTINPSATISITSVQAGSGSNYSLAVATATNDPDDFPAGSFTSSASGSTLTGGSNTTVYDTGTVTVTVATTSKTSNYVNGSTPASIAADLASQFHNDLASLVDATALGSTLSLTSRASGAATNYSLSVSSATTNTTYFSQPSFVGTPSGATLTGGATGEATLYNLALTYAPDGSIQTSNDNVNGSWSYGYDEFNRLLSSNKNGGAQTFTYDYDRYGNRWRQNAPQGGAAPQYEFDANNRIVGSGITYDAAGNVANDGLGHMFTYDAENRIVSVNGGAASYVYDAAGARVRKITGSGAVDYLYDLGGHVVAELNNGAWTRGEVFAGGRHLANYSAGTTYFVHADWLGTERVRSEVSGLVCETIANLPFGDGQSMNFANGCTGDVSPLHFTGKQSDPESGLDDFPARYYSPIAGRWTSPDWAANAVAVPYANFGRPQSLNLYSYVGNNPVTFGDADGHKVRLKDLTEAQRNELIKELEEQTGLTLQYNAETGELEVVGDPSQATGGSKVERDGLLSAIRSNDVYNVVNAAYYHFDMTWYQRLACLFCSSNIPIIGGRYDKDKKNVILNFAYIERRQKENAWDPGLLGIIFSHELIGHGVMNLRDPAPLSWAQNAVDVENDIRHQLGNWQRNDEGSDCEGGMCHLGFYNNPDPKSKANFAVMDLPEDPNK